MQGKDKSNRDENNLGNQRLASKEIIITFIIGVLSFIGCFLFGGFVVLISLAVFVMGIIYNYRMSRGLIERKLRWVAISSIIIGVIPIVIYSILAISSYMTLNSSAKEQATKSEIQNIVKALELYSSDDPNDYYPLTKDYPKVLQSGGYMSNIPKDDTWGKPYLYQCDDGCSYILRGGGPNKRLSDEDDIMVIDSMFQ